MGLIILEPSSLEQQRRRAIEASVPISKTRGFGAAISSGIRDNFTAQGLDLIGSLTGNTQHITAQEANDKFDPIKPFTEDTTYSKAKIASDRQYYQAQQQAIIAGAGLGTVGQISGRLVGGLLDPIALVTGAALETASTAAGMSLIKANRLSRLGELLSVSARTGTTGQVLGRQIVENLAFSSAVEAPFAKHVMEDIYQEEFTYKDFALSVATGTAVGTLGAKLGAFYQNNKMAKKIDSKITADVTLKELVEADLTGKYPDLDSALETRMSKLKEYALNEQHRNNAYKSFGGDNNSLYTAHEVSTEGSFLGKAVSNGEQYGVGVTTSSNPARAESSLIHLTEGTVSVYDKTKLNLLDIDEPLSLGSKQERAVERELSALFGETKAAQMIEESRSIKDLFDSLKDNDKAIELEMQTSINEQLKKEGIDGFTYKSETDTQAFIFDTGIEKSGTNVIPHTVDLEKVNTFFSENVGKTPLVPGSKTLDDLKVEEQFKDNPIHQTETARNEYKDVYSQEVFNLEKTLPETPEQIVLQYEDMVNSFKLDSDIKDLPTHQKAFQKETLKNVEKAKQRLADLERDTKALIACSRRNK